LGKEVGLPQPEQSDAEMSAIYAKIKEGTFLPRLRSRENWFISYQLNQQELVQILKLASGYLPFLNQTDEDGLSVKEKIIRTFEFRIPYYVGPISDRSGNHWAVRFAGKEREKVYPWNFETVIDTDSSAALFIKNSTGRCEYTGEPVLPKDSLLYSEFLLLNELNTIRVKDQPLSRDMKAQIVRDPFHSPDRRKQVTKRDLCNYLQAQGMDITYNDFKGIGINFKTALRSYHDFKDILDRTGDADMVEAIIQSVLVFRTDKKMLRRWLKRNTHGLTEGDIKMICGLQYQEWGTLSQTFLTEIYSPDENGEAKTIMDGLRDTDCDLTQLLSEDFQFAEQAQAHLDALFGCGQALDQQLIERRIPAALRRSIRQTLRIVDEIADMEKSAPKKIFLEVDNGNGLATKTRRTVNRKDELIALYKGCHETDSELYEQLVSEDEDSLRSNKLYLYYDQFGKCMYSGESIDREVLMQGGTYDIDHIIPQSKLRDHTMYNLVLVKSQLNREKADNYPIKAEIRQKMRRFWSRLRTQNMISKEKYDRLIRGTDLLRSELTRFVARQLNQNRNCVNMLTSLLEEAYGVTEIVYSKADNVADFRHRFGFVRCPNVNDLYHAKDA
jgi:CRISPR-associated endonuclease Csn1